MKPSSILTLAIAWLLVAQGIAQAGATYNFVTLDVPGSASTAAYGCSGSTIVGSFSDSSGKTHGFIYDMTNDNYTTLDVPGATLYTSANGISGNTIVGACRSQGGFYYSFIYDMTTGVYTNESDPFGTWGTSYSKSSGKTVVGVSIHPINQTGERGMIYDMTTGTYTDFAIPSAFAGITYGTGISGSTIVGYYITDGSDYYSGNIHGYIYDTSNDSYTTLDVPGAAESRALDMSGNTVVGFFSNSKYDRQFHSYIYDRINDTYTTLDFPGAAQTCAYGISGSTLVGTYADNGSQWHGFVAIPAPEPATLSLLALGGMAMLRRRK